MDLYSASSPKPLMHCVQNFRTVFNFLFYFVFNGPLSRTTQVSRYTTGKVKPIWILLKQETVSGSGISWAICKSASRFRQITTPVPHPSVFYRLDALSAAQPTVSKHWRHQFSILVVVVKTKPLGMQASITQRLSQARMNWEGCGRKGVRRKNGVRRWRHR